MADGLREIIDCAREACPEIPNDVWDRFERAIRRNFGTTRPYIAAHKKRSHLEAIAEAAEQQTADELSKKLGVGVRRLQQLLKLNT